MKYLKISNKGELDMRLVSLMGGTTKENDQFKIGKFGTGLKYALAYLVRNNIHFKIWIGDTEVYVDTREEHIRNEIFDVIYVNGERTSLTTKMGQDWKGWMIVRELWCNALDEDDPIVKETTNPNADQGGRTTFSLQLTGEIKEVWESWDKYFIHDVEPICQNERYAIYPAFDKDLRLYKNGVLIHREEVTRRPLFCYDIKDANINELREYRGGVYYDLYKVWMTANTKAIEMLLSNIVNSYESDIDFDYGSWSKPSDSWREIIGNNLIIGESTSQNLEKRGMLSEEKKETLLILPDSLYKKLACSFDGISAVSAKGEINTFVEHNNQEVVDCVACIIEKLEKGGYLVPDDIIFKYGFFEDKTKMADAHVKKRIIRISDVILEHADQYAASTIIEEVEHIRTGFGDETRSFQQHFIDLYAGTILDKADIHGIINAPDNKLL